MKIEYCELLDTEWGKHSQVLVGTITLKDGKLSYKAEKGHEMEMKNVMAQQKLDGENPTDWFNRLPEIFWGAALRAHLLKKGERHGREGAKLMSLQDYISEEGERPWPN